MNRHPLPLLFLMLSAAGLGCSKDNTGGSTGYPPPPPGNPAPGSITVTTVAGQNQPGRQNGPVNSSSFSAPVDVAVATDGTIYVADFKNHRIRKIADGQVSTFVGNDTLGILNGNGTHAEVAEPYRIALDGNGFLYIVEQNDPRVRRVSPSADITTFAGTSVPGFLNGAALAAQFQLDAGGVVADANGDIFVDDAVNSRIRKIDVEGQVTTVAGNGTQGLVNGAGNISEFNFPDGIAVDRQDNLYVCDYGNFCIRKIAPDGTVSRFAGNGTRGFAEGDPNTAEFSTIGDIVVDSTGNLYITDDSRIRKITPQGFVSTIAGSTEGFADGDGASAKFRDPMGLAIDAQGNIYVADVNNNRIRKISFK
jgi:streptogramin lyase